MAPPVARSTGNLRRRPQLSDDVAVHVRNVIMSGGVRPGEFIRLDETAAELGVSVTPVREALLTLRGEGLVELVPHRGYVVAPLSRDDVNDVFWLQGRIAEELAGRAVDHVDDEALAELTAINDRLRQAVELGDAVRIEELRVRIPSHHQSFGRGPEVVVVPARRHSLHPGPFLFGRSRVGRRGRGQPRATRRGPRRSGPRRRRGRDPRPFRRRREASGSTPGNDRNLGLIAWSGRSPAGNSDAVDERCAGPWTACGGRHAGNIPRQRREYTSTEDGPLAPEWRRAIQPR